MTDRISGARQGWSLLELAVSLVLFVIILGVCWTVFVMGRRAEVVGEREACLEAAILAQERIESDLRRIVVEPRSQPLFVHPDGLGMYFWIISGTDPGDGLLVNPLIYRAAGQTNQKQGQGLLRIEKGEEDRIGHPYVQGAKFQRIDTEVGPMVRVVLSLDAEGRKSHSAFAVRLRIPADLGREELEESYPFEKNGEFGGDPFDLQS